MAIVSGYQKMKDYIKQSSGYKLISRWANANTLECDDGKTLQSKVGGISGISSSLTANSTTQAASTNLTNQLYQNMKKINIYVGTDNKLHFINSVGADSVLPFNKVSYTDFSIPEGTVQKVISLSDIPGSTEIIGAGATERIYTGWTGLSVSYTSTQVTLSWGIDTGAGNKPVTAYGNWKVRVWWR